jgi:hypothetical protein
VQLAEAEQGGQARPRPHARRDRAEVNLALAKGAKGIVYFSTCDSGAYGWPASYDPTEAPQAARITAINARLNPPVAPPPIVTPPPATQPTTAPTTQPATPLPAEVVALQVKVEAQSQAIAAVSDRQQQLDEWLKSFPARAPPTTAPTTQPTTQPTTAPTTQPAAAFPRVYFETNVTPVPIENPAWVADEKRSETDKNGQPRLILNADWVDYAVAKGCTPMTFAYNGTLNRAFTWCDDAGNPRPMKVTGYGGDALDWSRQRNACDPIDPVAARAVARLAKNPGFYGFAPAASPRLLVFDVERTNTMNLPANATTLERRRMLQRWIDAVKTAKAEGVEAAIWSGPPFFPGMPDTIDLERQLAASCRASGWRRTTTT